MGLQTFEFLWRKPYGVSRRVVIRVRRRSFVDREYRCLVAGYRDLLRTPGVGRMITSQLAARFPSGMTALAILLHVEQRTGSYGAAGLVLAATSVGQALAGPVTSRWM